MKLERWGGETVQAEGPWGWAAVFKGIRKPLASSKGVRRLGGRMDRSCQDDRGWLIGFWLE